MVFKSNLPLLLFFFIFVSTYALAYQEEQDPQIQYQECQRRCQQEEGSGGWKQQQQCQQSCKDRRQEQERRQGGPQQQYEQCRQQCQQQQQRLSQQEQLRCQYLCEEQLQQQQEQQRQQGSRSTRDPQQEYQQCRESCQQEQGSQGQGQQQQQQQQCEQRCEEKRQEQEHQQRDPQQEYQQCRESCQLEQGSQGQGQQQQQQQCEQRCEERRQEQERQQRDPQQQYQQCQQQCEQQGQQQSHCQQRCDEQLQQQEQQGENMGEQQQQEQEQQGRNNPYFLSEESFQERFRTQHGYTRVTQRFSQLSSLLRGIENYRLGVFEANPSTFMIPHHLDADAVFFVVRGRGTVNLVHQQNKESYNLEQGDLIRIPAGALLYLINRDNNDKFQITSLFQPVSTPTDRFREFFGVGGINPESYFNTFSNEILEAAFNTPREQLQKLFGQQMKGEIVEASHEQIRALTRDASSSQEGSPRRSISGSQSRGPYNIFNQRPTASNEYGQLYRVDANKYRQLQDLDLEVAHYNIIQGAMVAPFYNSKATSLVVVVDGRGRFEMACPHLSSSQSESQGQGRETQQQEGGSAHYQRVSAHLSPRTAFIIPAGHTVSITASDNQNLQIVAFKINAENNQRNYLAGQNNVLNQLEREAKELSFNMPAREVEAILNNQRQSVFLPGPNQRQQQQSEKGRHGGMSIMDFLGF